jgi:hypothetical protein
VEGGIGLRERVKRLRKNRIGGQDGRKSHLRGGRKGFGGGTGGFSTEAEDFAAESVP